MSEHYYGERGTPYEATEIIEATGNGEGFHKGNAIKYLMRAGKKPGAHAALDYLKAAWACVRLSLLAAEDGRAPFNQYSLEDVEDEIIRVMRGGAPAGAPTAATMIDSSLVTFREQFNKVTEEADRCE